MARNKKTAIELPEVSVSDDGEVRHLHLGTPWIQGSMRVAEPFEIELQYVQRMMAWLLFVEPASVGDGRQPGAAPAQAGKVVDLRVADAGVQAAHPLAAGVHVPQAQAPRQQPVAAQAVVLPVRQRVLRPERLHNAPEMVLRVRIVLPRPQ